MAYATGAFFLAFLLSASFVDEINMSMGAVGKLVDYQYNFNSSLLLPGVRYNSSITAAWAIPNSAISGFEGRRVAVKVSALAENGSGVSFLLPLGAESPQAEAYLFCDVANGSCANSSVLRAEIPLAITVAPGAENTALITLRSEVEQGAVLIGGSAAGSLLDSISRAFSSNSSQNGSGASLFPNLSANLSGGQDFLDSLKPEGNSSNPVDFLRQNPLISIAALAIVVIITGAYLLNVKD